MTWMRTGSLSPAPRASPAGSPGLVPSSNVYAPVIPTSGTRRPAVCRVTDVLSYRFTPSDRSASTVDEFLAVCEAEPALAADHLQRGYFEPWLRDTGRPDLAAVATQTRATDSPADDALAEFLRAAVVSATSKRTRRTSPSKIRNSSSRKRG